MKGLLAGLVVGFALGVVVALPFREKRDLPAPPPRPPAAVPQTSGRLAPLPGPGDETSAGPVAAPARVDPVCAGRVSGPRAATGARPAGADPHPEKSWNDAELVDALRTLAAGGAVSLHENPFWAANRVTAQIWIRSSPPTLLRMPTSAVEALLDSDVRGMRVVGASLLAVAEPLMLDRITALAQSDPDSAVRRTVVGTLHAVARKEPRLVDLLTRATRDPSPEVRCSALNTLANLVEWRPSLGQWIVAGTRDPDANVRESAINLLRMAGEAGASRATEMLLEGEFDLDSLRDLLRPAVAGGRMGEILDRQPRPEVVTALVATLEDQEGIDLSDLAGRFEELLPLYQPEGFDDESYEPFFQVAVRAGETAFLGEMMAAPKQARAVRLGALAACLYEEKTRDLGLDGLRSILRDHSSTARFREAALEMLEESDDAIRKSPVALELVREAATADPSLWVRSRAEEILRELE